MGDRLPSSVRTGCAPGRLDLLGGVADYAGALVLEVPTRAMTTVTATPDDAFSVGEVRFGASALRSLSMRPYQEIQEQLAGVPRWTRYLIGVALVFLAPGSATINGLALVIIAGLFGIGTLHVLSGRMPAFVHGMHGLLAYGVFLSYLTGLAFPGIQFWFYLKFMAALHALLLAVFLGGMTTGQRGFGQPIGAFYLPRRLAHWTVAAHIVAALTVVATLGWLMPAYPVAFYLAVTQVAVGFLLANAVNLKPKNPGTIVAFHQSMVLLITVAIVVA